MSIRWLGHTSILTSVAVYTELLMLYCCFKHVNTTCSKSYTSKSPKKCIFSTPVCGGLRADQGRQLQEEGGSGWGGGPDRHSGHCRPGGLRCHQGQLFSQRGGLPASLLHHRAWVLHCHCGVQVLYPAYICLCGDWEHVNGAPMGGGL